MKADKYLESIGLENVIDEEFFNDDDKSWYKVQELMEAYHQSKLDLLTIPDVSSMFSAKQMEEAWINGCGCGESRSGYFDIENYS